mmetsp:Transcript_5998/g.20268  ORF Transcript_5998/g.20268 Transcript_5998/m.20268 type:complete len:212 (-) Transcript_5998:2809-3444(-)
MNRRCRRSRGSTGGVRIATLPFLFPHQPSMRWPCDASLSPAATVWRSSSERGWLTCVPTTCRLLPAAAAAAAPPRARDLRSDGFPVGVLIKLKQSCVRGWLLLTRLGQTVANFLFATAFTQSHSWRRSWRAPESLTVLRSRVMLKMGRRSCVKGSTRTQANAPTDGQCRISRIARRIRRARCAQICSQASCPNADRRREAMNADVRAGSIL